MVTTKQKPVLNTQKIIRKKPKHTIKERHQDTQEKSTRRKKKHKYKTVRKNQQNDNKRTSVNN